MNRLKQLTEAARLMMIALCVTLFLASCDKKEDAVAVNIAAIQGVTNPVAGSAPVTTITETEQYTGVVAWTPAVSGTFAAGTDYTAVITLTAKSGYTFNGVTANFFTVEGAATVSNAANSGVVTAKFPETIVASGTAGSLTWKITADRTLIISGTGEISYNNRPWHEYRSFFTALVIEYGVMSIGNHVFGDYRSLTSVTIPNSVTSIGEAAFISCSRVTKLTIGNSVTNIGYEAFVFFSNHLTEIINYATTPPAIDLKWKNLKRIYL